MVITRTLRRETTTIMRSLVKAATVYALNGMPCSEREALIKIGYLLNKGIKE